MMSSTTMETTTPKVVTDDEQEEVEGQQSQKKDDSNTNETTGNNVGVNDDDKDKKQDEEPREDSIDSIIDTKKRDIENAVTKLLTVYDIEAIECLEQLSELLASLLSEVVNHIQLQQLLQPSSSTESETPSSSVSLLLSNLVDVGTPVTQTMNMEITNPSIQRYGSRVLGLLASMDTLQRQLQQLEQSQKQQQQQHHFPQQVGMTTLCQVIENHPADITLHQDVCHSISERILFLSPPLPAVAGKKGGGSRTSMIIANNNNSLSNSMLWDASKGSLLNASFSGGQPQQDQQKRKSSTNQPRRPPPPSSRLRPQFVEDDDVERILDVVIPLLLLEERMNDNDNDDGKIDDGTDSNKKKNGAHESQETTTTQPTTNIRSIYDSGLIILGQLLCKNVTLQSKLVSTLCVLIANAISIDNFKHQQEACDILCDRISLTQSTLQDFDISMIVDTVVVPLLQGGGGGTTTGGSSGSGSNNNKDQKQQQQHKTELYCSCMNILERLAHNNHTIQSQLTENIAKITKLVLKEEKNAKIRQYAFAALTSLCSNHTKNQELLLQPQQTGNISGLSNTGGLSLIFDTMKWHPYNVELQYEALNLLGSLSYSNHPSSKVMMLAKGGLDCILTSMREHLEVPSIQASGCRTIATIFANIDETLKQAKGVMCIKTCLNSLRLHPHEPMVQYYGCCAVRNLGRILHEKVSQLGGMGTLLVAVRNHMDNVRIQEQANAALFNLLSQGTLDDIISLCSEGGIGTILNILRRHPSHPQVQFHALGVLSCLSTKHAPRNDEIIIANKGLDLVLSSMKEANYRVEKSMKARAGGGGPPSPPTSPSPSPRPQTSPGKTWLRKKVAITTTTSPTNSGGNPPSKNSNTDKAPTTRRSSAANIAPAGGTSIATGIIRHCCKILQNLTTTGDFQRAVIAKMGLPIILTSMKLHLSNQEVQQFGCMTIRNLCLVEDNMHIISKEGGMISVLAAMKAHALRYEPIQAYGSDALALLVGGQDNNSNRIMMLAKQGITIVVNGMSTYPTSVPVQEQGCHFLHNMSILNEATVWMKNYDVLEIVQDSLKVIPQGSKFRPYAMNLQQHLQDSKVFMSKNR